MKRVRMLLRVSSNQQLEADGDLSVQRQLVKDYISNQPDWQLDEKEYFEGSNSGYKNAVVDRNILQEALQDAKAKEYDILVVYKIIHHLLAGIHLIIYNPTSLLQCIRHIFFPVLEHGAIGINSK